MKIDEVERIRKSYEKRDKSGKGKLYSHFDQAALFITQGRERGILSWLTKFTMTNLDDKIILDLGCGSGNVLRDFLKYGARPENCYGIDLLDSRIEEAKRLSPNINFICGNAENLPYEDNFFDIILCFTVFSSILDKTMKRNVASEMIRVMKPSGIILWFDYHMNNPSNPDVRGIKKEEIQNLFLGCNVYLRRVTLAPPIARKVAPYSWLFCYLLERLGFLNTHYLGVIAKKN